MHMRSYLLIMALSSLGVHNTGLWASDAGRGQGPESDAPCSNEVAPLGYEGYWTTLCATAYSPVDPIDSEYHATKGEKWRWITADGRTDVRKKPYGIAVSLLGRKPRLPFGTKIYVPKETGYLARTRRDRVFEVDDVGNGKDFFKTKNGCLHIEVRFKTHASAISWAGPEGFRFIKVFMVTGTKDTVLAEKLTLPPIIPTILPPKWQEPQRPLPLQE